ncbi:MAG: hypothetical protein ACK5P1_04840, partial [Sphingobacteriia bacterium]
MKHPRLTLLALLLLNSVLSTAHAQPTIEWDRTLGGSGTDFLADFWLTADGGYILGGSSQSNTSGEKSEDGRGDWDVWVMKLNADRTIQWQRTLGGNKYDALCDFYQTVDGGYILGGTSSSNVSGEKTENSRGGSDYWVIKLSATGTIEWQKTLGGSANDALYPVRQTSDGGYILGGESISNSSGEKTQNNRGGYDYWVVKLSATGNIEWDRTLGGSEWDLPRMLWQTSDGGYILGGESFSDISGEKTENSRGEQDGWLIKLDAAGNKVWDKTLGGSKGDGFGLFQLAVDGGYILGGWSSSDISGEKTENSRGGSDYWLVKLCDTPIKPTLGPDFAMACPGSEPDTLRTDEIAGLDYHWYRVSGPGSETPLAGDAHELEVLSPGTYIVEVENDCGLTERDTVVVSESAHPDASSLLPETAELCSGPVTLGPEVSITTYTFGWEDLGWGGISPRTFTEPGTYILRVIEFSAPDCPGYDTVVVSGGSAPTKPTLGPDRPWCRWTDQNANDPAYPPAASNPSLAGPVGSLLTYTWWRNGTELTSQTSRTLAI